MFISTTETSKLSSSLVQGVVADHARQSQSHAQWHPGAFVQATLPWLGGARRPRGAGVHVGALHRLHRRPSPRSWWQDIQQHGTSGGGRAMGKPCSNFILLNTSDSSDIL